MLSEPPSTVLSTNSMLGIVSTLGCRLRSTALWVWPKASWPSPLTRSRSLAVCELSFLWAEASLLSHHGVSLIHTGGSSHHWRHVQPQARRTQHHVRLLALLDALRRLANDVGQHMLVSDGARKPPGSGSCVCGTRISRPWPMA